LSLRSDYDQWHKKAHEASAGNEDAASPWYQLVREYLGEVTGLRVLEVACGRGGFSWELARAGARVAGCDFSLAALLASRSKATQLPASATAGFIQGDAARLPFESSSFDVTISCETIEHVPDVRAALWEMYRVTRPGGKLLLTTPNYANLMGLYEMYARIRHPGRKDDQPFDRRQWFPQVKSWVRNGGWTILRTDGTVHQFPIVPGRSPLRAGFLESSKMMRKILSPLALHYFVLAQKRVDG